MRVEGYSGNIEFDGRTIKIDRAGTIGALGFKGVKAIPIQSIVSVQFKKPSLFTNGYIQFDTSGGEKKNLMLDGTSAGSLNENKVNFQSWSLEEFETLRDAVEEAIEKAANSKGASGASESPLDALKKLKELLDLGVISQEEFESKKTKLMGEI